MYGGVGVHGGGAGDEGGVVLMGGEDDARKGGGDAVRSGVAEEGCGAAGFDEGDDAKAWVVEDGRKNMCFRRNYCCFIFQVLLFFLIILIGFLIRICFA